MATRQLRQLRRRGCHLLIITPTQLIYCVLLIANSCRKGLELAILPDIFLGQRAAKKTDFSRIQVVARNQRGQLGYQSVGAYDLCADGSGLSGRRSGCQYDIHRSGTRTFFFFA